MYEEAFFGELRFLYAAAATPATRTHATMKTAATAPMSSSTLSAFDDSSGGLPTPLPALGICEESSRGRSKRSSADKVTMLWRSFLDSPLAAVTCQRVRFRGERHRERKQPCDERRGLQGQYVYCHHEQVLVEQKPRRAHLGRADD